MKVNLATLTTPSPKRDAPLPVQIYHDLHKAIREGRLSDGARLPSSRAGAHALGLSRASVSAAYELLSAEGVVQVRPGAAPRVLAPEQKAPPPAGHPPALSKRGEALSRNHRASENHTATTGHMAPGLPDEALFPRAHWGLALRRAARCLYGGVSGYDSPHGLAALREQLAARIAADRGVRANPDHLLITPGTQASLALLSHLIAEPQHVAAMEDPGHVGARAAFLGAGLKVAPVGIDDEGLKVSDIPPAARLIYVTPSNQYPLGQRLSMRRRMALLRHAQRHNALILEDDYDSEFLWKGREIAALAALGEGHVAYLGSASKTLMPALRLGWVLLPEALSAPARYAQRNLGLLASLHPQAALADLLNSGHYKAHLRAISRQYQQRGTALARALQEIPGLSVRIPAGGVQLAARFTPERPEAPVLSHLASAGFRPAGLSTSSLQGQTGLLIGFADATPQRIESFRKALRTALREPPIT